MKKIVVVFVVLLSLTLAQVGQAADLNAEWYVNIYSVYIWTYGQDNQPVLRGNGSLGLQPGIYVPFLVTDEPHHNQYTREASVINNISVPAGTSVDFPVGTGLASNDIIAAFDLSWETNYDASQMQLQLIQRRGMDDIILWSQSLSGHQGPGGNTWIARDILADGLVLRVVAVPEPSTLLTILVPLSLLGSTLLKKRLRI